MPTGLSLQTPLGDEPLVLEGIAVSPGIAIGEALVYSVPSFDPERVPDEPVSPDTERERYDSACQRAERELRKVANFAREKLGESSAGIFEAHAMILQDETIQSEIVSLIRDGRTAGQAVQIAFDEARKRLESSGSAYLRERARDFVDVQHRLLRNLQRRRALSRIETERVVVAENLSAADVLLFSRRSVLAIATDFGGATSHVSIMARSLGVPAVASLHGLSQVLRGGEPIIVDGFTGRVYLNPDEDTIAAYRTRGDLYRAGLADRAAVADLPAETTDGTRVTLRANLELEEELPLMREHRAEGVGLYRTELLLLARGRPLDEAEQLSVYRSVVQAAAPHPTTFRLLDLGGDKMLPMAHREENPFLGWRGVRVLLDKPEILMPQLRALLQAATEGPVRLLVPMISSLEEVHRIRHHLQDAASSLEADGLPFVDDLPLGIMVEVPSVALAASHYATEVDFFSIGTNDLTQFTLAVDRGNDLVADRYREMHPVVLRLLRDVIEAGAQRGIPVSLCGEMAGNPRATPLLLGLGLREFSASPVFLPDVKRAIRAASLADCEALAEEALAQPDAQSVATLTDLWLRERLPMLAPFYDGRPDQAG